MLSPLTVSVKGNATGAARRIRKDAGGAAPRQRGMWRNILAGNKTTQVRINGPGRGFWGWNEGLFFANHLAGAFFAHQDADAEVNRVGAWLEGGGVISQHGQDIDIERSTNRNDQRCNGRPVH